MRHVSALPLEWAIKPNFRLSADGLLWSTVCFKIVTRYTCVFFFPRILVMIPATRYTCVFLPRLFAFFPALWGFYSQVYDHFLTNAHIYAHKKTHVYALQTSMCIWGHRKLSYKRHWIIPSAKKKKHSCTMELKSNFSLNQPWPQRPR